jgi:hypothetical protein
VAIFYSLFGHSEFCERLRIGDCSRELAAMAVRVAEETAVKKNEFPEPLVVDQETAARMIGVSASTLRRWRRQGVGPEAICISRLVRYRPRDLEQFLASSKTRHADERRSDAEKRLGSSTSARSTR